MRAGRVRVVQARAVNSFDVQGNGTKLSGFGFRNPEIDFPEWLNMSETKKIDTIREVVGQAPDVRHRLVELLRGQLLAWLGALVSGALLKKLRA